jgi:plasmid stabilization system protein ParE
MAFPIRYSTRAYIEYEQILEYVSTKFGIEKAMKVDQYFEEVIDQISLNPYMFPLSDKKKDVRRCVISEQTTLYYRFTKEYIELISFRGNKMNPESLGF